MKIEQLDYNDPDHIMLVTYKRAHNINRDLNDCDVVVLMRRAREDEQRAKERAQKEANELWHQQNPESMGR